MGILDNLRRMQTKSDIEKARKGLDQKVAKLTREDYSFFEEYSVFSSGLSKSLSDILDRRNGLEIGEVVYEPQHRKYAKYFIQAMEDPKFKDLYEIQSTPGGHYRFRLKTLQETRQEYTDKLIKKKQDSEFKKNKNFVRGNHK